MLIKQRGGKFAVVGVGGVLATYATIKEAWYHQQKGVPPRTTKEAEAFYKRCKPQGR